MKAVLEQTLVSVTLPEMGESVTEGSIVEWRKRVGDFVAEGDPLVEVTTDKVDVEVPAPASGVVTQLLAREGQTVAVGSVLAEIDSSKLDGAPPVSTPRNGAPPSAPPRAPLATPGERLADAPARRIARRLGVDLSLVRGSGPNGLILRSDVLEQAQGARRPVPAASPSIPIPLNAKVTPLKGPAAALTAYMEQSLSIPTATSFRSVPVDVLDARRKELNGGVRAAGRSERISFTHLIAYALVRAAQEMPFITYSFRRDQAGSPARLEPGIHLGLAVDTERKDGTRSLVVPVIRDADTLDFAAFRARYEELVGAARENKLTADDLQGASFTLTNPGGIGTIASVPRLMAGQGAILATGAIGYPAGFATANEQSLRLLGVSRVMQITSTYDHRVIQGAQSGEFLRRVDELLQGAGGFYEALFASLGLQAAPVPQVALAVGAPSAQPSDEILRRRHGDRRGISPARSSRRESRPARRRAGRRRIARTADVRSHAGAAKCDSRRRAAGEGAGSHACRRAAAPQRDV
jgi:2-oxoglutarate decarboxylase